MRILTVEPGPNFSVADVHRGWIRALKRAGHDVANLSFAARLEFYEKARRDENGEERYTTEDACRLAAKGLLTACYELWPDVVLITSGFYVPDDVLNLMRDRGHKVVLLHTESPYEDDKQIQRAALADLNLINDPTNIDRFPANTVYAPHAYDPAVHYPDPDPQYDFGFVGTGYPSRVKFFEQVDLDGLDVALAGNWQAIDDTSPLAKYLLHDRSECFPNDLTADLYRRTRISANLYRKEAHHEALIAGWAMGPREVELAACGAFFLTEPRGENRDVLPMVPTFSTPDELGEQIRWWLAHPEARAEVVREARAAVADRTFDNNVRLLQQSI